jgi:hypothetical protein
MLKKTIDLDALTRVLGQPPRRYAKSDPRNLYRSIWWQRALSAVGLLMYAKLPSTKNVKPGGRSKPYCIEHHQSEPATAHPHTDGHNRSAAARGAK